MAEFVLDASVANSWCFPGDPSENTPYSRAILQRLRGEEAVVPEIWPFEIANSLYVSRSKRARITELQITEYLQLLRALPDPGATPGLVGKRGVGVSRATL